MPLRHYCRKTSAGRHILVDQNHSWGSIGGITHPQISVLDRTFIHYGIQWWSRVSADALPVPSKEKRACLFRPALRPHVKVNRQARMNMDRSDPGLIVIDDETSFIVAE